MFLGRGYLRICTTELCIFMAGFARFLLSGPMISATKLLPPSIAEIIDKSDNAAMSTSSTVSSNMNNVVTAARSPPTKPKRPPPPQQLSNGGAASATGTSSHHHQHPHAANGGDGGARANTGAVMTPDDSSIELINDHLDTLM